MTSKYLFSALSSLLISDCNVDTFDLLLLLLSENG